MSVNSKMTAIADAIRGKTGKTEEMTLDQMVTEIEGIEAGGGGEEITVDMLANNEWPNGSITLLSEELPQHSLQSRKGFTVVYAPNLVGVGIGIFHSCSGITEAYFPKLPRTSIDFMTLCTNLKKVDFGACTQIVSRTFVSANSLDTIILRAHTLVPLDNINAFEATAFRGYGGKTGTVYCHAAFITEYQQATNWSTLYAAGTCNFVAIEGSEYE